MNNTVMQTETPEVKFSEALENSPKNLFTAEGTEIVGSNDGKRTFFLNPFNILAGSPA